MLFGRFPSQRPSFFTTSLVAASLTSTSATASSFRECPTVQHPQTRKNRRLLSFCTSGSSYPCPIRVGTAANYCDRQPEYVSSDNPTSSSAQTLLPQLKVDYPRKPLTRPLMLYLRIPGVQQLHGAGRRTMYTPYRTSEGQSG